MIINEQVINIKIGKKKEEKISLYTKFKLFRKHLKEKKLLRKQWIDNFNELNNYSKTLKKTALTLNSRELTLDDREKQIIKKEYRITEYEDIESYIPGLRIFNWFKKKFIKPLIVMLLVTKTKGLRIMLKRVDGYTIKDDKKEYKINPDYLLRGKKFFIGVFLENKLEQLQVNQIDKCPVSASNFARIFDDTLIQKVFSPREKPESKIGIIFLVIAGIVLLILILHFSGVIDLKELLSGLGSFTGAQNATTQSPPPVV